MGMDKHNDALKWSITGGEGTVTLTLTWSHEESTAKDLFRHLPLPGNGEVINGTGNQIHSKTITIGKTPEEEPETPPPRPPDPKPNPSPVRPQYPYPTLVSGSNAHYRASVRRQRPRTPSGEVMRPWSSPPGSIKETYDGQSPWSTPPATTYRARGAGPQGTAPPTGSVGNLTSRHSRSLSAPNTAGNAPRSRTPTSHMNHISSTPGQRWSTASEWGSPTHTAAQSEPRVRLKYLSSDDWAKQPSPPTKQIEKKLHTSDSYPALRPQSRSFTTNNNTKWKSSTTTSLSQSRSFTPTRRSQPSLTRRSQPSPPTRKPSFLSKIIPQKILSRFQSPVPKRTYSSGFEDHYSEDSGSSSESEDEDHYSPDSNGFKPPPSSNGGSQRVLIKRHTKTISQEDEDSNGSESYGFVSRGKIRTRGIGEYPTEL